MNGGTAAGWYGDPSGAFELRYWDGGRWTEHVATGGVQSTSPVPPSATSGTSRSLLEADVFTVRRHGQPRDEDEHALDVVADGAVLGRFVPVLDGVPGYRLDAADDTVLLTARKPSLKARFQVALGDGTPVGSIDKVGRLHSRYDLAGDDGAAAGSVKLAPGGVDAWEVRVDGDVVARVVRRATPGGDPSTVAAADYDVSLRPKLDAGLHHLVLAVPVAIDVLDTQAPAGAP